MRADGRVAGAIVGAARSLVAGATRTLVAGATRMLVAGATRTLVAGATRTLVAGAAMSLVACGGPDTVAPEAWAKSVCQAVRPWTSEIRGLQRTASAKISAKTNADQTKTELVRLFGGMAETTDAALTRVREAGIPDVDGGERIADRFVAALTAARDSFATGKDVVASLPTDDPARFYRDVVAAGTAMSKENGKAGAAFSDISSPELDAAFSQVAECR